MKFSIRGILLATTFIALLLAAFVAPPVIGSAIILLLWPLVTTAVVGAAIYSRGAWQAFAIGAAVPTALLGAISYLLTVVFAFDGQLTGTALMTQIVNLLEEIALGVRILVTVTLVTTIFCGGLNVAIRQLFRERGEP